MIKLGLSITSTIRNKVGSVVNWILSTGSWDDTKNWNDLENWKDS